MDIDSLVDNNNNDEKKKLFLIKKQNTLFIKKIKNMNTLIDETLEMIEKDMMQKKMEINKWSDLFFQNAKHYKQIINNLEIE